MATASVAEVESSHYSKVAENYESAVFYEDGSPYQSFLLEALGPTLQPLRPRWIRDTSTASTTTTATTNTAATAKDNEVASNPATTAPATAGNEKVVHLADIGGGTGNFTVALMAALGMPSSSGLVVDPYPEMLAKVAAAVQTQELDAVAFAKKGAEFRYDVALLKEVLHHIPLDEIQVMFKGIHEQLYDGGVCICITRPHKAQYPFFAAAHKVWEDNQPETKNYTDAMTAAGFSTVTLEEHDYRFNLKAGRWYQMVRNRFWSTFTHFTDAELEQGLAELRERYGAEENDLTFTDRLMFVIGRK